MQGRGGRNFREDFFKINLGRGEEISSQELTLLDRKVGDWLTE